MIHQCSITPPPSVSLCMHIYNAPLLPGPLCVSVHAYLQCSINTLLPDPLCVSVYMHIYNAPSILYSPAPSMSLYMHIYNAPLLPGTLCVSVHAYLQYSITSPTPSLCVSVHIYNAPLLPGPLYVSLCIQGHEYATADELSELRKAEVRELHRYYDMP